MMSESNVTVGNLCENMLAVDEATTFIQNKLNTTIQPLFAKNGLTERKISLFFTDGESWFFSFYPQEDTWNSDFAMLIPLQSALGRQYAEMAAYDEAYTVVGNTVWATDSWSESVTEIAQGGEEDDVLLYLKRTVGKSIGAYGFYNGRAIQGDELIAYFNKIVARECCVMHSMYLAANDKGKVQPYPMQWISLTPMPEEMAYTRYPSEVRFELSALKPVANPTATASMSDSGKVDTSSRSDEKVVVKSNAETSNESMPQPKKDSVKNPIKIVLAVVLPIFGVLAALAMVTTFVPALFEMELNIIPVVLLLLSGAAEIIVGIVLYCVYLHKQRYTCPNCGTKRIHHRTYLGTDEQISKTRDSRGYITTIKYTHRYHDVYECPNCGETYEENTKVGGGQITEQANGKIIDRRTPPKEF